MDAYLQALNKMLGPDGQVRTPSRAGSVTMSVSGPNAPIVVRGVSPAPVRVRRLTSGPAVGTYRQMATEPIAAYPPAEPVAMPLPGRPADFAALSASIRYQAQPVMSNLSGVPPSSAFGMVDRGVSPRPFVNIPRSQPGTPTTSYVPAPQPVVTRIPMAASIAVAAPAPVGAVTPTTSFVPPVMMPVQTGGVLTTPTSSFVPPVMAPASQDRQTVQAIMGPASVTVPLPAEPGPPPANLTAGLPNPKRVEEQKAMYNKALEEQRARGEQAIRLKQQERADYLRKTAEAQKQQLLLQIEQQVKQQELQMAQEYNVELMHVNTQYQHSRLALEQQANGIVLEYQQRKAHEDMMKQQYDMQLKAHGEQMRHFKELQEAQSGAASAAVAPMPMHTAVAPAAPAPAGMIPAVPAGMIHSAQTPQHIARTNGVVQMPAAASGRTPATPLWQAV
eukprot:TRINITY_DN74556_c0_g1_i1.p1 TRINITY_DN74556_c0_g1~~TRINITY_DN74556_c0_g1_i1.p1  ORF type:complete len:447 (-),score=85.14 TRINITY_DN74556_c0_g1_i1:83-1423(-)